MFAVASDGPIAVLLRNAMTSPDADARLRAALLSAVLMGVASQRYLMQMPDLASADDQDILRILTPVLAGPLTPESS